MNLLKNELRQKLKSSRLSINQAELQVKNLIIDEKLSTLFNWSKIKSIHIYEPILSLSEVDITNFINSLYNDYSNLDVFTTRKISGKWQIYSLRTNKTAKKPLLDIVIVPMLGFDKNLHRIGYGGGYYDKFLNSQPQARKIGICFETGKVERVPSEIHDITMDVIVTEHKIYV